MSTAIDPDLLRDFLLESRENLARLDGDLVEYEKNPNDHARLKEIFRAVHTIKGTSSFLALTKLERVAHVGETLLSNLREGELKFTADMASALLAMVDAIRNMVGEVEASATDGDDAYEALVARLDQLATGKAAELAPAPLPPPIASAPAPLPSAPSAPAVPQATAPLPTAPPPAESPTAPPALASVPHPAPSVPRPPGSAEAANETDAAKSQSVVESTVRVDVVLLDRVMNLVGELVLARNQILQYSTAARDAALADASQRLNLLTTELHESVMKTRMQPIGNVWSRFPRIVRDLAISCGKKCEIELDGSHTELDRTIIEAIKDPLTHLVRNAIDHGLETPDQRAAAGKPETGRLRLRSYHEGGQVNVEIADDGAGINLDRVRAKAIDSGLFTPERLSRMSDHELMQVIFLPGFSTAAKVTNLSGRGVGMDVVKTNIERIGGTVDLSSERNKGTTVKIKLPLTLAIVPALVVETAGERFALPQVNLLELLRLEGPEKLKQIERVSGVAVYRLRGNLLPLVFLEETLGLSNTRVDTDVVNIVVLQAGDRQFGLVVDRVRDTEEIVVKPLGKSLKGVREFSGATIMGDGKVALILDVLGLAAAANMPTTADAAKLRAEAAHQDAAADQQGESLLAFRVGRRRLALPLAAVARLEELPTTQIEFAAGRDVVQYRGGIMPLIDMREVLGTEVNNDVAKLQVIVFSKGSRSVGLVVDQILDIIQEAVHLDEGTNSDLLRGSMVLQGKVTDLLDVVQVIRQREHTFFDGPRLAEAA